MRSTAAATRYARALFDVVLKETPANVEKPSPTLLDSPTSSRRTVLAGVRATRDSRREEARGRAGAARARGRSRRRSQGDPVAGGEGPARAVPDMAKAYRERLMDHLNIVRGEVTTAVPLADDKLRVLEQGLAKATGRKVVLESRVDASIIGGAVTRLGSTVYDGSITTQLEKMKQALIEAGQ
jgi:F-type H+-transporting ATPase subunit delta